MQIIPIEPTPPPSEQIFSSFIIKPIVTMPKMVKFVSLNVCETEFRVTEFDFDEINAV